MRNQTRQTDDDELIIHICQNTVKTSTLVDIRPGYLILQPFFLAEDQKTNLCVCVIGIRVCT